MTLPPDKNPDEESQPVEPPDDDAQIGVSDSNLKPPPGAPGDSAIPDDSILGSVAEPVHQSKGYIPPRDVPKDTDKTVIMSADDTPQEIPADSIMQDLAEPASMMMDLNAEHQSIRIAPGTLVKNRFKVIKQLGEGGMGAVYLVEDVQLGKQRALKVMLPRLVNDKIAQQRFLTEIKVLQELTHESIVRVYDLDFDEKMGLQFFTMANVPGKTLHQHIFDSGGKLPQDEVIAIAQKLCLALKFAHAKTIHRDLKPANVMINESGDITILDFGLAKLLDPNFLAHSNMVMGTFNYQSPEQRTDPTAVTLRTDLFSLGIMIYEMLTGEVPAGSFDPPSHLVKGVSKKLDRVVMKCLQNRQERRFQSADELWEELESAKSGFRGLGLPLPKPRLPGDGEGPGRSSARSIVRAAEAVIPGPPPVKRVGAIVLLVTLVATFGWIVYSQWFTVDLDTVRIEAVAAQKAAKDSIRVGRFAADELATATEAFEEAVRADDAQTPRIAARAYVRARDGFLEAADVAGEREDIFDEKMDQVASAKTASETTRETIGTSSDRRIIGLLANAEGERSIAIAAVQADDPDTALGSYAKIMEFYEDATSLRVALANEISLRETRALLDRAQTETLLEKELAEADTLYAQGRTAESDGDYSGASEYYVQAKARYETLIISTDDLLSGIRQRVIDEIALAGEAQASLPDNAAEFATESVEEAQQLLEEAVAARGAGDYVTALRLFQNARRAFTVARAEAERNGGRVLLAREQMNQAKTNATSAKERALDNEADTVATEITADANALFVQAEGIEATDPAGAKDLYRQARDGYSDAYSETLLAKGEARTQDAMVEAKNQATSARDELPSYLSNYNPEQITSANAKYAEAEQFETASNYTDARQAFNDSFALYNEAAAAATTAYREEDGLLQTAKAEANAAKKALNAEVGEYASNEITEADGQFEQALALENADDLAESIEQFQTAKATYERAGTVAQDGLQTALVSAREEATNAQTAASTIQAAYTTNDEERGLEDFTSGNALFEEASANADTDTLTSLRLATRRFKESRTLFASAREAADRPSRMEVARETMDLNRITAANQQSEFPQDGTPFGQDSFKIAKATYDEAMAAEQSEQIEDAVSLYARANGEFQAARKSYDAELQDAIDTQEDARAAADTAKSEFRPGANNEGRTDFASADEVYQQAVARVDADDHLAATPLFNQAAEGFLLAQKQADEAPVETVTEPVAPVDPPVEPAGGASAGVGPIKQQAATARDKIVNSTERYSLRPKKTAQTAWDEAVALEGAGNIAGATAKYQDAFDLYSKMRPQPNSRTDR